MRNFGNFLKNLEIQFFQKFQKSKTKAAKIKKFVFLGEGSSILRANMKNNGEQTEG